MKKTYLFILSFILLIALSWLYINYLHYNFRQMCEDTRINQQIARCINDSWIDNYQKLAYLRSKSEYITGDTALSVYWDYATRYNGLPSDKKKIIEISKQCLTTDPHCISVYIDLLSPSLEEQFFLYENYLMTLKNICDNETYSMVYRDLAKKLSYPVKFNQKCY